MVKDEPISIRYNKGGPIRITPGGTFREPILLWQRTTVIQLILDLTEALQKAWPHADVKGTSPYDNGQS